MLLKNQIMMLMLDLGWRPNNGIVDKCASSPFHSRQLEEWNLRNSPLLKHPNHSVSFAFGNDQWP